MNTAYDFTRDFFPDLLEQYGYVLQESWGDGFGRSAARLSSTKSPVSLMIKCSDGTCFLSEVTHNRKNWYWTVEQLFDLVCNSVKPPSIAAPSCEVEKAAFIIRNFEVIQKAFSDENVQKTIEKIGYEERPY